MKKFLPIDDFLTNIQELFKNNSSLIISATPGAGKTTRVPVALAQICQKQVWVLEPRRIAAVSAAAHIADENQWKLGEDIGYQVRFESKSSPHTKILFMTEALLLRKLMQDPELSQVEVVILDEFHERSIHVDLALAALKELQELARPDLKIVVMSATIDAQALSEFLSQAPVLQIPGKVFPNEIRFDDKPQLLQTGPEFIERIRKLLVKAVNENSSGDILCFLPGRGEIERLQRTLTETFSQIAIHALHGQLNLQEQRQAIVEQPGQRKIILSTNIAESSLTVEGVRIVVDSGLARITRQDTRHGLESLELARISKASATQRAGRAARLGPGVVYRAWSVHEENSFTAFETPEIQRVDLAETLLLLSSIGVSSPEQFSWFEKPNARAVERATQFLFSLGALLENGRLSPLGQKLRQTPLHPRLSKLLVMGEQKGVPLFAAELAAMLSEGKREKGEIFPENDVMAVYDQWRKNPQKNKMALRASEQLKQWLGVQGFAKTPSDELVSELLLEIYGDRLCRRRGPGVQEAKMVGGRGVRLHPSSNVKESEFFLAIEIVEGRDVAFATVFQAVGVPVELVEKFLVPQAEEKKDLVWDDDKQKFYVVESLQWMGLSVTNEKRRPAEPKEMSDRLVDVAITQWEQILKKNEILREWWGRLQFLSRQKTEFPLLSEGQIREALEMACYNEKSLEAVEKKDLLPFFTHFLNEKHKTFLDKECPSHWIVPTGNRYKVLYTEEQGPQVEVRLQELFGLSQTPMICGQPLTLFLLAPNYRPVQVTRDLQSFWKNGYPEVRKEMRARYPKHSWPDDPLTAPPQAKGRRR